MASGSKDWGRQSARANSDVQTSLQTIADSTLFALQNQLRGMFSWRLDNDHGLQGQNEDVEPTFTGAKTIYDTVQARGAAPTPER